MEPIEIILASQKLKKLYRQTFARLKHEWQLTQIEVDILLFLANNPGYDTARDIVELRDLSKSQVSQAVEKLHRRGLLLPEADKADRRCTHLHLTPASRPLTQQARALQVSFRDAILAGIPAAERLILQKSLAQVIKNAEGGLGHAG